MSHISNAIQRENRNFQMKSVLNSAVSLISAASQKLTRAPSTAAEELDEAAGGLIKVVKALDPRFDFGLPAGDNAEAKKAADELGKEILELRQKLVLAEAAGLKAKVDLAMALQTIEQAALKETADEPAAAETPTAENTVAPSDVPVAPKPRGRRAKLASEPVTE